MGGCFIEDSCFIHIILEEMSRHFACLPWGLMCLLVLWGMLRFILSTGQTSIASCTFLPKV